MPSWERERTYYRIQFPLKERPRLTVAGREYEVLDCSETGLRYRADPADRLAAGDLVQGRLRFSRGAEVELECAVVRVQDLDVAVSIQGDTIPLAIIWDEQRYLAKRYPMMNG